MHPLIATRSDSIAALCRQYGVRRLDVFGSLLRDDFNEDSSDIDLVVELDPAPVGANIDRYFGLKHALEALFARPVDLVELGSMPNTRLKRLIERSKVPVYGTAA
jgi:predicted nucleotidyltransferase